MYLNKKLGWGKEGDDKITMDDKQYPTLKKNIMELFSSNTKINLDLIFLDEAHFGMSTPKAGEILSQIKTLCGDTPKVFVTATYNKPLSVYGVDEESKLTWDLSDIEIMKNLSHSTYQNNKIRDRFGDEIYDTTKKIMQNN